MNIFEKRTLQQFCMYTIHIYIDRPVVKITAAMGGCGYVYASWTTTGSSDVCRIAQYYVTLSSATVNLIISISGMNSHNFTLITSLDYLMILYLMSL